MSASRLKRKITKRIGCKNEYGPNVQLQTSMLYLKCTKIVRDFAGIRAGSIDKRLDEPCVFGSWYVNMFTVDRRKTLIFMSERTLMSFISHGVKKSNSSDIRHIFLCGLEHLLQMEDVRENKIRQIINTYADARYAQTDSRSALGNLNDLVFACKYDILYNGGFSRCHIGNIIQAVNRTPQRNLGWRTSIKVMHERLESGS